MKKQMTREEKEQTVEQPIVAYKGFDKNMQCRGFQYEVGKTYEHEGKVDVCCSGFHSCEYPPDIFGYYDPASSRFAAVNASGQIIRETDGDSKIASSFIAVKAKIGLADLTARAVDWIVSKLDRSIKQTVTTGNRSAATNTGDRSAATNTGNCSAATNTGSCSAATNTGSWSAATNTGDRSAATNTGDWSAATNTGSRSAATNTGDCSAATNTGSCSAATNTGDWSAATNTGNYSAAEVTGEGSVAASLGIKCRARASAGSAIVLCCRQDNGTLIHIRASKVGENGIKPDTWYTLNEHGEFVEDCDDEQAA